MRKINISLDNIAILITGAAGFIGAALVQKLLHLPGRIQIIGIDNLNDYYDVSLKKYRLNEIEKNISQNTPCKWHFEYGDISDPLFVKQIFQTYHPDIVVNLAAQAGVRYSITHPDLYIKSNIIGFYNILEACRHSYDNTQPGVRHLVYASSSSVYGLNNKTPYSLEDNVDHPVSLYAASKKSNELMSHAYSKLYNIPSTGIRFFTVYRPAGRPDMTYFSFTEKLLTGKTIEIFNYGNCKRDFTYIDDIIDGIVCIMQCAPEKKQGTDGLPVPPYKLYNIGNSHPENLLDFVDTLQKELIISGLLPVNYDFSAHKKLVPMQPGDVGITYADISDLMSDFNFSPSTSLAFGLHKFVQWYKSFYF